MSMLSKSRLGVCQPKLECGGSYETEDAVGREEGSLTDIRTHDEGKDLARGEARAATGRGLLGISLVVTTFTSEVGRFSHHRLRAARSTAARHPSLPPPQSLPAKPGNGQRNTELGQPGSTLSGTNTSLPT